MFSMTLISCALVLVGLYLSQSVHSLDPSDVLPPPSSSPPPPLPRLHRTVLVIGAGAAGMAAATRLMANGFDVTILEAENRYGGRVYTVPYGANVVEMGAVWCHGRRGNVVYDMAHSYPNLLSSNTARTDDTVFYRSNGGTIPVEKAEKLRALGRLILHDDANADQMLYSNQSVGAYFMSQYTPAMRTAPYSDIDAEVSKEFVDNLEKFEGWDGAWDNWFDASAAGYKNYWDNAGDLLQNWRTNGYRTVFRLLMNRMPGARGPVLAADRRIQYNREVVRINWWPWLPQPIVECADGSRWTADHVICTVSLGVLKERTPRGFFVPALPPNKRVAIEGLMHGTIDKFYLEFPQPFWPKGWVGFSLTWSDADIRLLGERDEWLKDVFAFYPIDFQPNLLCGWMVGKNARHMETLSEAEVRDGAMVLLRRFLRVTGWVVPEPVSFRRSQWFSNPHFRGSYSYMSRRGDFLGSSHEALASPLLRDSGAPIVQFAGEATHNHYFSTVHGAIETGWREADRLIGAT